MACAPECIEDDTKVVLAPINGNTKAKGMSGIFTEMPRARETWA